MQVDWELSQSLLSDGDGVRSACILPSKSDDNSTYQVVTGSQRGGVTIFQIPSGDLANKTTLQHDHAVTSMLSSGGSNNNLYATGCKDTHIRLIDADTHTIVATLKGHERPVTSLSWASATANDDDNNSYLVSGSWDGTARVWDVQRQCVVAILPDHENSVCVAGLPSKDAKVLRIVTGSAGVAQNNAISGHTIRLWTVNVETGSVEMLHKVVNDHDGPIRDVCTLTDSSHNVASCSNDGTVKLRDAATGQAHATLTFAVEQQHPPMLLSVTQLLQSSSIAVSAEDGHVVVWDLSDDNNNNNAAAPQTIRHPTSVWQVLECPNGDMATCCDDGILRIFTRASDRVASQGDRQAFVDTVQAAKQKQSTGPSPDEIAKLPQWSDRLARPGKSEGQVCVFQRDGIAIAAQWSAVSATWIEVGQVMGSSDKDQGTIDGVSYDHVFPIEVDTTGGGVATLRIGCNTGDNPFVAAQRFIDAHQLPQYHLQEVANYLQQRVGQGAGPTLGGGGAPAATTGVPIGSFEHMPSSDYIKLGLPAKNASESLEKMKSKMQEFRGVNDDEWSKVERITAGLSSNNSQAITTADDISIVSKLLEVWPPAQAFAALDLARLTILQPVDVPSALWAEILDKAIALCSPNTLPKDGPAANAIPMLTIRLFSNAVAGSDSARASVFSRIDAVLSCVAQFMQTSNKNTRLAIATFLYNSCHYCKVSGSNNKSAISQISQKVVPMLSTVFRNKTYESEAVLRSLVALGTLIMASPEAKQLAQKMYMASQVEPAASPHGPNVKLAAKEAYALLQ